MVASESDNPCMDSHGQGRYPAQAISNVINILR
jgi:hypothetical protein